jgi:hypothetical protein
VVSRKLWRREGRRKKRRGTKRGKSEILIAGIELTVVLVGSAETVTALRATPGDPKVVKDHVASHAPAPGLAAMKGSCIFIVNSFD